MPVKESFKGLVRATLAAVSVYIDSSLLATPPNIILLLTDDQGFADVGIHKNPDVKTPTIDHFARQSIGFSRFYVTPVCAPTRAGLMTGRYHYRTGITDTWKGRTNMHQDEVTLAEILREAGYATGLFGKWHLGDTYPYRPQDQGFDEVLMHRGGGIGQPCDILGNTYFNPTLWHNGDAKSYIGYCMDIYTDATLDFIEANRNRPFFAFLATNTPHTPLQVPKSYYQPYIDAGLPEETSKIYGMVTNIDDNFARVLAKLKELEIADETIVIFMSDNGPKIFHPKHRFAAKLRGEKTDLYEGGILSPFYFRWPDRFPEPTTIETIGSYIDVMPTLLAAAEVGLPDLKIDGLNLYPLMEGTASEWPDRTIHLQWHRGDSPEAYRHMCAVTQDFKLVQSQGKFDATADPIFELYDLANDPGEKNDLAAMHPDIIVEMKNNYSDWLADVSASRGYTALPSWIGSSAENPVTLTQQDQRGGGMWGTDEYFNNAYWPIRILQRGAYSVSFELFAPADNDGTATLQLGEIILDTKVSRGDQSVTFKPHTIPMGDYQLTARVDYPFRTAAPRFIHLELIANGVTSNSSYRGRNQIEASIPLQANW